MTCARRHQAITWTSVDWTSMRSSDIHLMTIWQEIPEASVIEISLKIIYPKFHSHLPEANELKYSFVEGDQNRLIRQELFVSYVFLRLQYQISYFQIHTKDRYLQHFTWNCPQVNDTSPRWWLVKTAADICLVPPGIKSLPGPLFFHMYFAIWRQ